MCISMHFSDVLWPKCPGIVMLKVLYNKLHTQKGTIFLFPKVLLLVVSPLYTVCSKMSHLYAGLCFATYPFSTYCCHGHRGKGNI